MTETKRVYKAGFDFGWRCAMRAQELAKERGLVPAGDCPSPVADNGDQATGADSPVESQTP